MGSAIRYSVFFALAILLWAVAEWLVGLHDKYIRYHEYFSYFFAVPSVGIMYLGIRSGGRPPENRMSFRSAFLRGLGITSVVSILCPLMWYLFCVFINPAFLDYMMRYAIEAKGMDPQLAMKRYSLSSHLFVSTLSTAVVGAVISLVVAIILARRKPAVSDAPTQSRIKPVP
ncbi:DUF4199 domain-containing protein [Parapedobacter deserti]|uniref:DUF4199 domain-containing protein n=1 Tax=Parapedobacter deserti TaxID=1912957 RepID=A0ABV7JME4_9SPHI